MAHLVNPLATASQLYHRASYASIPQDLQETIFLATQCLTQAAGLLLDLPQSVTAQANVILARFWLTEAPTAHEFSDASAAAIFLVSKIGPTPRSTRDVSNVYAYLLSSESTFFRTSPDPPRNDPHSYYQTDSDYHSFQSRILALEAQILTALAFNTHVSLPHALAITYLQTLDFASHNKTEISRRTLQYLNTALLSPQMLYLTHQPHTLATSAIYNAAKDVGAKMPECAWWEVFDVDREELGFLVVGMRSVEGVMRERNALIGHGMVTRRKIEKEMQARGLCTTNGSKEIDQEDEVMKAMDNR